MIRKQVLDDLGYVELVGYLGDDLAVVDAARVSFAKDSTKYTPEQNDKLLKYLRDHDHGSPFEMVTFKFRVKAPVVVWWQWVRHRMASYNFVSGRYVPFNEDEVYTPTEWRMQSKSNKQGSSGEVAGEWDAMRFSNERDRLYADAFRLYNDMLANGVAKEQARLVLPFAAMHYEAIVQMNARSLQNFLKLRCGGEAQSEIRAYAEAIRDIVKTTHPRLFADF